MITPNLNDGESYVEGRSEETARKLFEAAEKAGIDTAKISTSSHGYVVPTELIGKTEGVEETKIKLDAPNGINIAKEENQHVTATGINDQPGDPGHEDEQYADDDSADGAFNPADHTVEEVKEYLDEADEKERDRVIAAEEASEKPRRGILKLADEEEGDK